jgi:DNA-binding MarR family transcriptional regulator
MSRERYGFELPLLLAGTFRALIDALHQELARQGHPEARPLHGFALQALGPDGATISDLGRRLGVSKQAAAKTAASLEQVGYLRRVPDPRDARAQLLLRTDHGTDMLTRSAEIFEQLREDITGQIGQRRLAELEDDLETIATSHGSLKLGDLPGWLR